MVTLVRAGEITAITLSSDSLSLKAVKKDGSTVVAERKPGSTLLQYLRDAGVPYENVPPITVEKPDDDFDFPPLLVMLLPATLLVIVLVLLSRGARPSGVSSPYSNVRVSPFKEAKLNIQFCGSETGVTFEDVAGIDEVKDELQEIVLFLKSPERFRRLGARVPRGVLLTGAPGTGKTMLAKAIAGEAGVPFISINASEFVEMFVGVGASRIRDLFKKARETAPCIVFIDELDAVGRRRSHSSFTSNNEQEHTLNQLLVEMDGFANHENVVIIAATNRADILDPALLRPGRFDRQVQTELPDCAGRESILRVHARGKPLAPSVDLAALASETSGMSGADLENLLNEAALFAVRRNAEVIDENDLADALEKVIAGVAHKNRAVRDEERRLAAVHEGGHAILTHVLPTVEKVNKVSIVARAGKGGYTRLSGHQDRRYWTEEQLREHLVFCLAGLAAEELVFSKRSTGAGNDLEQANALARAMVYRYGMGDIGLLVYNPQMDNEWLLSGKIVDTAEESVRKILDEALLSARRTLEQYRAHLDALVAGLLQHDALDGERLRALLDNIPSP